MDRRTFLMGSALAAQSPGRIRIAFLGASHPHGAAKVEVARQNPDFELVGVAESDPALQARFSRAGIPALTRARLLEDKSIQAVAVESAVKDHAADARAALRAGKHVHVEKPPATDLAGLRELLSLAAPRRQLLQPGYMWRRHPAFKTALEAARNGSLGEVFMVRGCINTLLTDEQRLDIAGYAGGQMFELGGHLVDPLIRLLAPRKVTPVLQKLGRDGLADNTAATFEFPRAIGIISTASVQPGASRYRSFEIHGTKLIFYTMSAEVIHSRQIASLKTA